MQKFATISNDELPTQNAVVKIKIIFFLNYGCFCNVQKIIIAKCPEFQGLEILLHIQLLNLCFSKTQCL